MRCKAPDQTASWMCANRLRFCSFCSSCCTLCPVSSAVELATARRTACGLGVKGFGGGGLRFCMMKFRRYRYSVPGDLAAREKTSI